MIGSALDWDFVQTEWTKRQGRYACLQKNPSLNGEGTLNWRYANRKEERLIDGENGERPRLQLML